MMYAKISRGVIEKYPYTIGELREDNPNTSFPTILDAKLLAEFGVVEVVYKAPPAITYTQNLVEQAPKYTGSVWEQSWGVVRASEEEIAKRTEDKASEVRNQRNTLLAKSDWTQGRDIPMEVSEAWATYRAQLRDVPNQSGFPFSIDWPIPPQ